MNPNNLYADLPAGSGPDGSSLLGFLSSVGALVSFTTIYPDKKVTLHWEQSLGWRGRVLIDGKRIEDGEIRRLHKYLTLRFHKKWIDLKVVNWLGKAEKKPKSFYLNPDQISSADALANLKNLCARHALGSKALFDRLAGIYGVAKTGSDDYADATKLCALGSSQQWFFEHVRMLCETRALPQYGKNGKVKNQAAIDNDSGTGSSDLTTALFEAWTYPDRKPGMRWDPVEDRYYALRHMDPSVNKKTNAIRTQRGANRLGIEALSVFPLIPNTKRVETPGFSYSKENGHRFTWPVWDSRLTLPAVKVLICHAALTKDIPKLGDLSSLGVKAIFRVKRLVKDKGQVSFTISETL